MNSIPIDLSIILKQEKKSLYSFMCYMNFGIGELTGIGIEQYGNVFIFTISLN